MRIAVPVLGDSQLAGAIPAAAQGDPAKFEVVSIKESPLPTAGAGGSFSVALFIGSRPGGRFEANNATAYRLLQYARRLLASGPDRRWSRVDGRVRVTLPG